MEQKPPIFIGGAGRSGTTLIRVILDSHSNIACGPEFKFTPLITEFWYQLQDNYKLFKNMFNEYQISDIDIDNITGNMLLSFLDKYRIKRGKSRIAEKSPNNILVFFQLHKILPQSPLVHVVRDGRDVITSLLSMDWKDQNGIAINYTKDIISAAKYWKQIIDIGKQFKNFSNIAASHYLQIKYEDVILSPEITLKNLFKFIDEPWESDVLNYHKQERNLVKESSSNQVSKKMYSSSIGRWKKELTSEQVNSIKPIIGSTLIELGYAKDLNW